MTFEFDKKRLMESCVELIRQTSVDLGKDIEDKICTSIQIEEAGSPAESVLTQIIDNVKLAREKGTPVCQDTGTNIYYVSIPVGVSMLEVSECIIEATKIATEKSYLRPNAVDPVTGKNSGDNTGIYAPYINFEEWDREAIGVKLMLKGGGSENVSSQYKLPDSGLDAGRNLKGVYKCVIDAVTKAQGLGCAPGILGIGIGGDRATGVLIAKKQLFRKLDDTNSDEELAQFERIVEADCNKLHIGPMGFGGKTTLLGVKAGKAHRLPASYFVSIAYMCWANRRKEMIFTDSEVTYD